MFVTLTRVVDQFFYTEDSRKSKPCQECDEDRGTDIPWLLGWGRPRNYCPRTPEGRSEGTSFHTNYSTVRLTEALWFWAGDVQLPVERVG